MLEQIPAPRTETRETAPQIISLSIPTDKIRDVGSGGRLSAVRDTGATVDIRRMAPSLSLALTVLPRLLQSASRLSSRFQR